MHRAYVYQERDRERGEGGGGEGEGEIEMARVIHESRAFSHCATPRIAGGVLDARAAGMPLVCLSAVSVAYRNPVVRFRVGLRTRLPRALKCN